MALIAASVERPGVARIFFDMQAKDPSPDDEQAIAVAIEAAFAMALTAAEAKPRPVET